MRKKNECDCCAPEGGVCCAFDPDYLVKGGQGRAPESLVPEATSFGVIVGIGLGVVLASLGWGAYLVLVS